MLRGRLPQASWSVADVDTVIFPARVVAVDHQPARRAGIVRPGAVDQQRVEEHDRTGWSEQIPAGRRVDEAERDG